MMQKQFLTTYNIAAYCQVTPRTAVQWINEGKLRAHRTPGKHSRVSIEDFLAFLKKYNMPVPSELADPASLPNERKRILIVDDDKEMIDALERVLLREKIYDLQVAYDGFEAGQKFTEFRPDLVISDLKMPGLDGDKLCARIRSQNANKDVKIILISGITNEVELRRIETLGADAYLSKPFKIQTLREEIQRLLGKEIDEDKK